MDKLLFISIALSFLFSSCTSDVPVKASDNAELISVAHAGGILWGRDEFGNYTSFSGSNSLEGLEMCADMGVDAVELDFSFTSDGYLACIHDWSPAFIKEVDGNKPLTLDEFLDSKIYGIFTPISLSEVADFLRAHEEITIVTDIKDDFYSAIKLISETGMTDRFTVQIYCEEEYDIACEFGFERMIYTLYRLDWNEKTNVKEITKFADTHQLAGIAFDKVLCSNYDYVKQMKNIGVPLFVHTVNENEKLYLKMGISGIYTDKVCRK